MQDRPATVQRALSIDFPRTPVLVWRGNFQSGKIAANAAAPGNFHGCANSDFEIIGKVNHNVPGRGFQPRVCESCAAGSQNRDNRPAGGFHAQPALDGTNMNRPATAFNLGMACDVIYIDAAAAGGRLHLSVTLVDLDCPATSLQVHSFAGANGKSAATRGGDDLPAHRAN